MNSRQQPKRHESRWSHTEYRHKVTLADFYERRLNAPGVIPECGIEAARLLGGPVDQERVPLREACRVPDKRLAARARKFLTLGAIYAQRETFGKQQAEGLKWERWLSSFMSPADVKSMVKLQRARQAADNARNDREES